MEGELLFLRRPVAPNPDSSVEIMESRKIHMEDGSPGSALSLSVEGSRFYVLTMAEKDGSRRTHLDDTGGDPA